MFTSVAAEIEPAPAKPFAIVTLPPEEAMVALGEARL